MYDLNQIIIVHFLLLLGWPFNQLAALSESRHCYLEALYYYLRRYYNNNNNNNNNDYDH